MTKVLDVRGILGKPTFYRRFREWDLEHVLIYTVKHTYGTSHFYINVENNGYFLELENEDFISPVLSELEYYLAEYVISCLDLEV